MTEPQDPTEEETATSEFAAEVTTDDAARYESSDYESAYEGNREDAKQQKIQKRRTWRERCVERRWNREDESLWRVYMKSYVESRQERKKNDVFLLRSLTDVVRLPIEQVVDETVPHFECLPLGGFQIEHRTEAPAKLKRCKTRIWRSLRTRQSANTIGINHKLTRVNSGGWPDVWPRTTRDLTSEWIARERGTKRRRDVFPCDPPVDDEDELLMRKKWDDFADRKELGHVRTPVTCPESQLELLVDRACGERPGLVDGDYIVTELTPAGRDKRIYAYVVLRGLKGMHLPELGSSRERRHTWKFCFYQAVVALLAKTQLRYKYAWSANIDYIYDHAWTLYTHIGAINVKDRQRLDDVVVYNYKYSVELELIQELKDVQVARNVDWGYEEADVSRRIALRRKDPLNVRVELGCQKITNRECVPVHEDARELEEWFDELSAQYRNCVFRTTRFSLAFWRDNFFWYLYNPYRCDVFGFWDDDGRACIAKFCSKESLRRHLMILLLRAYAYGRPESEDNENQSQTEEDTFDVQIFGVTFHCCQLHNLKLLQCGASRAPKSRAPCVDKSLDLDDRDVVDSEEDEVDDSNKDSREKPAWLKCLRVTWARCAVASQKRRPSKIVADSGKARWHYYYMEEANKLFSLWGEIHITDTMFDEENRGMQAYACYVVCAGMTRITAPEYWSPKILDVIVMCGDRYYAHSRTEAENDEYARARAPAYLSDCFRIGGTVFEAKLLPAICGALYTRSSECLWRTLRRMFSAHHFGVLTCESACLGLFKFCGSYYMCDVNSHGPPLFRYGHGAAYLLRATSFRRFITALVLTISSSARSRFSLNPIEILRVVETRRGSYFDTTVARLHAAPKDSVNAEQGRLENPAAERGRP